MRGGHPRWTGTDDRDFLGPERLLPFRKDIDGIARFRSMTLSDETLQGANGDGHIKLSAPTSRLAGMAAHAATDGGERIGDPGVAVSFLVPPLRNQRDVPSGLGVNRARLHTGEVRFEPLEVD